MEKCLYCYNELEAGQTDFHPSCARKFFGTKEVPVLPYVRKQLVDLAEQVIRSKVTLTGVQPKLSLDVLRGTKKEPVRFTIVGLWGRYILKPQIDLYDSLPELEDVTMHLAELSKIRVVPHSLIRFKDGELCYITQRIDRMKNGAKIPMEDLCQLSERLTEYKYKGSYEQIAKIIMKYSSAPMLDLVNFWEVVLFSWITGNSDMHLKNFSLYNIQNEEYVLTPAYDLLSTALALPQDSEELALTLNGKKRKIDKGDFVVSMKASGLGEKVIENIFNKFLNSKVLWNGFIEKSFLSSQMKMNYNCLIENKCSKLF